MRDCHSSSDQEAERPRPKCGLRTNLCSAGFQTPEDRQETVTEFGGSSKRADLGGQSEGIFKTKIWR